MARSQKPLKADTNSAALNTPSDLGGNATGAVAAELALLVADAFALYVKTKNFHWHMTGPHFRDYHLLLDEHADQIFATTDPLAERARKIGEKTLRSIGQINQLTRVRNNDAEFVPPLDMLRELLNDNREMAKNMRKAHQVCDDNGDVATASLLENYIDETERRTWFLFEATRDADPTGH